MTDEYDTITPDEAVELLEGVETRHLNVRFEGNSVIAEAEEAGVSLEFISLADDPELVVTERETFTTVSRYLIHMEDETFEVETDGPFNLVLEGVSGSVSDVILRHDEE